MHQLYLTSRMNTTLFSLLAVAIIGASLLVVVLMPDSETVDVVVPPLETDLEVATSSPPVVSEATSTSKKVTPAPVSVPKKPLTTTTVVVSTTTVQVNPPSPPISTSTQSSTIGTTTLAIQRVPLLVGGIVHAGGTVSISFLQITNVGKEGALLKGFWVTQNGSAPTESIIGLSTVDDKGGSRGLNGGVEGTILFQNGLAFAPTDAFFAPGQMRLFTIKAIMTQAVSAYVGTQLMIDVASIDTTATVKGQFPIRGTTWAIVE